MISRMWFPISLCCGFLLVLPGCSPGRGLESGPVSAAAAPTARGESAPQFVPISVDLRGRLTGLGFTPRAQGARGTCSIFTTCEAIEYALAMSGQRAARMSPEFLNWAGSQVIGRPSDGNFFHNALAGFDRFGLCDEAAMPYEMRYDPARAPSEEAVRQGTAVRTAAKSTLAVHWIVPWNAGKSGVNEQEFAEIKRVLRAGYPVAAGSSHSRLLVGYVDDAASAGGGIFLTEDSALARFDAVTYEFVRAKVNDVFWVEAISSH